MRTFFDKKAPGKILWGLFLMLCNQNATKHQKYVENKGFSVGSNPMSSVNTGKL